MESDASTMATYQEIINDKARMQRAIKVAKDRAKDLNKRANAMQSVATFKDGGKMNREVPCQGLPQVKQQVREGGSDGE